MGYSRDMRGRLCCDQCGRAGEVRRRSCRFKVTNADGSVLRYCYPPALCAGCFAELGGAKGVHGESCQQGAATSQAREDEIKAKLEAGDKEVKAAWGSWFKEVPEGQSLVLFRGLDGVSDYRLVPSEEYSSGGFLSDYPNNVVASHNGSPTKEGVL